MREKVKEVIKNTLGEDFKLEVPPAGFGDYSCGAAFALAKTEKRNPKVIAKELCKKFNSELFEKVEARDGFINFFISKEALKKELSEILKNKENYGKGNKQGTVVIDYSSPNIAKRFGIGHLRSTVIGHSLHNIYEFLGWKVEGVNHLGDWGTQFGKLIYQIKKEEIDPQSLTVSLMEQLYVRFHKTEDNDEEGRKWFSLLEKGNKEARQLWEICKKVSMEEFSKIYDILNIHIDHTIPESFYEDMLSNVIEEAKSISKESEGALIIEFEDMPPAMIRKSDGSTTYFTRDLVAAKYRIEKFKPNLFIYEIGADQTLHMKQLFRTIKMFSWGKDVEFVHVAHGLFRMKEGKLSTRKGRTVHLEDVLQEAQNKALDLIKNDAVKDKQKTAKEVGVGAIKYNDLKRHYKRNIEFDWDSVITLKGDSGPYLQYTALRCKSVLEKGGSYKNNTELPEEVFPIIREMIRFKEVVEDAAQNYSPNTIASFTYNLARIYNLFYDNYKITGNDARMAVTEATYILLCSALQLLTVSVPEKM